MVSNIQGVSARAMLEALIEGQTDAAKLADLAKRRLRSKIPELEAALAGRIRKHHRFMWREVLYHLDELNERLATLDAQIRRLTAPCEGIIERFDTRKGNHVLVEQIAADEVDKRPVAGGEETREGIDAEVGLPIVR